MVNLLTTADIPASLSSRVDDAELMLMVLGANSQALRVAPCLTDLTAVDEARLILYGAVKRWIEAGSGALQTQQAGPFSQTVDTRQRTGYALWPSEITALQAICADSASAGAFSISLSYESS